MGIVAPILQTWVLFLTVCSVANFQKLQDQQEWQLILKATSMCSLPPAEEDYHRGMALAMLGRWREAEMDFRNGRIAAPGDKRFPIELAGVYFRQGKLMQAKRSIQNALELDPADHYANDLLATLFYLEGNQEAALKYWNRLGKPWIHEIRFPPSVRLDPVLLDHAFAFSRASILEDSKYLETQQRLALFRIFPRFTLQLAPQQDGSFDLLFHGAEIHGAGSGKLETLFAVFHDLPQATLHLDFYNMRRSSMNFASSYRWDSDRRRMFLSFDAPLQNSTGRWQLHLDARDERWSLPQQRNVRQTALRAGLSLQFLTGSRWTFENGIDITQRNRTDAAAAEGLTFSYALGGRRELLRIPEHRFLIEGSAQGDLAQPLSSDSRFGHITAGLKAQWFPQTEGEDYRMLVQMRAGTAAGNLPLDEYFVLGSEPDTDLLLRAHHVSALQPKGKNPMGKKYVLANIEIDKILKAGALFHWTLSPFLDIGRVYDPPAQYDQRWLLDAGLQWKFSVLRFVQFRLIFARNIQQGSNTLYLEF